MKKEAYEQDTNSLLEWCTCIARKHGIQLSKLMTMFLLVKEEGPVGRYCIAEELGLSEGVTRGVLSRLQRLGVFNVSKEGCVITKMGANLLSDAFQSLRIKDFKFVNFDFLAIDRFCAVVHIPYERQSFSGVTMLRDKAVRAGASGAIILAYEKGKLMIPHVCDDLASMSPSLANNLKDEFSLVDNDLLIATFAPTIWKAKEATISVVI